jgi:hypothetical protein
MLEWLLILYVLNFYTTQILTSKFCIFECISLLIKVTDYHNARWKPETKKENVYFGGLDTRNSVYRNLKKFIYWSGLSDRIDQPLWRSQWRFWLYEEGGSWLSLRLPADQKRMYQNGQKFLKLLLIFLVYNHCQKSVTRNIVPCS